MSIANDMGRRATPLTVPQIRLLASWLCLGLVAYAAVRPTFYFYSYSIARLSDFSALAGFSAISLVGVIYSNQFPARTLALRLLWAIALGCTILISLIGQGLVSTFSGADFADLARPALMLMAIAAGYFITYAFVPLRTLEKIFFVLAALAAVIALAQYLAPNQTSFIWKVFSDKNAMYGFGTGRPTAFFYHFNELANFLVMCGLILIVHRPDATRIQQTVNFLLGITLIAASVISTSRVGLVFLILAGVYYSIEDLLLNFSARRMLLYLFILSASAAATTVLILTDKRYGALFTFIYSSIDHINLSALAKVNNKSIANRVQQILVYLDIVRHYDYRLLIGSGPMRHIEQSYFEIGWVKILFRYGAIGYIIYYGFYVFSFFIKAPPKLSRHAKIIRALCFAYFISDAVSSITEIVKGISMFLVWYGAVLGERDKITGTQVSNRASPNTSS